MLFESSISSSSRTDPCARSNSNRVESNKDDCSIEIFEFESSEGVCSIELEYFELRAGRSCSMLDSIAISREMSVQVKRLSLGVQVYEMERVNTIEYKVRLDG